MTHRHGREGLCQCGGSTRSGEAEPGERGAARAGSRKEALRRGAPGNNIPPRLVMLSGRLRGRARVVAFKID